MTKETAEAPRTQAESGPGPTVAHLVEPMLAGMTTTRQHLLAWVHAHGLAALDEVFREEAVDLAGAKGRHQAQRTHHHWGTVPTELTFGGRRVQVRRPRVRRTTGGEATLPSVAAFRARDPLTARMMQQFLAGVSMQRTTGVSKRAPSASASGAVARVPSVAPWCGGPNSGSKSSLPDAWTGWRSWPCSWTGSWSPSRR